MAQHPWQNEKHRQSGQDEPKRAFGVICHALGGLVILVHPNHRDKRGERQSDEQGREPIIEKLDFVHEDNDRRADEELHEIGGGEAENFFPRDARHGEEPHLRRTAD